MQSLTKLQHDFQAYLLQAPTTIAESIVPTENVTREVRLALYGDAYRERLIEALCNNYPKLFCYLGDGQFRELALQYIARYPSGFRSIRFFGGRLAMFLNKTLPYSEEGVLAELADFEWTLAYVFDAANAEPISLQALEGIAPQDWAELRFHPDPSLRFLEFYYNTVPIWQALDKESQPPASQSVSESTRWIVWRQAEQTHFRSLKEDEAWALGSLYQGQTFADLCEGLCHWHKPERVALQAASYLKSWLSAGLLAVFI